ARAERRWHARVSSPSRAALAIHEESTAIVLQVENAGAAMMWLVALTLLSPPGGDFWLRTLARSAEVERWKLEGDQRLAMGTAEHNAEAEQAYAEAVRLSPRDPRAHYDHANALNKLGRYLDQVAELLATRALDQHFEAAPVALDLGIAHARLG